MLVYTWATGRVLVSSRRSAIISISNQIHFEMRVSLMVYLQLQMLICLFGEGDVAFGLPFRISVTRPAADGIDRATTRFAL